MVWNPELRLYSTWDVLWGTPLEPGALPEAPAFAVMRVSGVPWMPGDMEPLVFLDESGARVAVPREFSPRVAGTYDTGSVDCVVDLLSYDLRGLPNGTYQIVHRYASMEGYTPQLRDVPRPQEYEGESAILGTFTLRRSARSPADAGSTGTDAGP